MAGSIGIPQFAGLTRTPPDAVVVKLSTCGIGTRGVLEFNALERVLVLKISKPGTRPPWEKIQAGLTLAGTCRNEECEANGKMVSPCKVQGETMDGESAGFGRFNMARDTCFCSCPMCGEEIGGEIVCLLYKCKWCFNGLQIYQEIEDGPVRRKSKSLETSASSASIMSTARHRLKFGEGVAASKIDFFAFLHDWDTAFWRYLEFEVAPLNNMDFDEEEESNEIHDKNLDWELEEM